MLPRQACPTHRVQQTLHSRVHAAQRAASDLQVDFRDADGRGITLDHITTHILGECGTWLHLQFQHSAVVGHSSTPLDLISNNNAK